MPRHRWDDIGRLQAKTSQTMLAAQRRGEMEANRLTARLNELRADEAWRERAWQREKRQSERQLSLSGLALSDSVISVADIGRDRPEASSAGERRKALDRLLRVGEGEGDVEDAGRRRRKRRPRRPESVFRPQLERQRKELLARAQELEGEDKAAGTAGTGEQRQPQPASKPPPQAHSVPCQYCASGRRCNRFPCCLPPTYSFISNKREMLQLYELLLDHLPEHRRPRSAASEAATSDLGSLISEAEYLVEAQNRVSTLDPVERARLLRMATEDWRRRHSGQMPQPRETRYGRPYPMRRVLKPVTCSSGFFLN